MDNKNKKRFIVIPALSMALCFTIGMTDLNAYVVRKNNAKISLTAGQSKKIKLAKSALKTVKNRKKSIKVKSANKKIVKIKRTKAQKRSYSFTIKALKKGKTTVIVKGNKKNIKIKVTVRDAADKNVVITDTNVITSTPPSVTAQLVVQTEAPNTPDPTIRPLRTRISVPASEPETRDGYTKLTDLTTYSINGDYLVNIWTDSESQYYYNVVCEGLEVVEISSLGLMLDNTDLTKGLTCDNEGSYVDEIYEEFETITLAAATSVNNCQERTIRFSNVDGAYFDLLIRVYNDGFAYRYTNVTYGEDYPGEYITYVRRHGEEWFIGSMTLEKRDAGIDLDFLTEGKKYTAYIYSSDDNGSLVESTQRVSHDDVFTLSLKDLDGVAVYITEDFY